MSDGIRYHFGLHIAGVLTWPQPVFDGFFEGRFTKPSGDGILETAEIRKILEGEVAAGHVVIPYGEICTNWDYRKGCQGHKPI